MKSEIQISVVSPVYKAENIVEELVKEVVFHVSKITEKFEIILVNDGSPDNSWEKIQEECTKDIRVKGVKLSRNFGQHYAISAGFKFAKGEWVILMDCDLQDRPDEIPKLYNKAQEGFQIVYTRRKGRQDHFLKRTSSTLFHAVFSYLSGSRSDKDIANFGIYHSQVITEFNKAKNYYRSFYTIMNSLGFKKCVLTVEHSDRFEGKSSYTLSKLLRLSFDIILSNTNKPLIMTVKLGMAMSLIAVLFALYNLLLYLTGNVNVQGFTSTIISIWLVGGINVFVLGIVGLYVGRTFDQVKGYPLFIVEEMINVNDNDA
jgi:dolichol-phosphate mannosyltransferase